MCRLITKLFSAFAKKNCYQLPERYKFLSVLGEGAFGRVLKCEDTKTKCNVAVKILKSERSDAEVSMLKKLMSSNLGKYHIIEYYDSFITRGGGAIVFELLDISLHDYILKNHGTPMPLSDIRAVVKQIAIALGALKDIKLIHCDIKPDNVMLVNHQRHPLQVKLIDFGLALPKEKVKIGMTVQTAAYRSPEVILGLPFSEAIDMWSVGCLMATMMAGASPFPAMNKYEAMQFIVEVLGLPPVHLLELGKYTGRHFIRTESGEWQFKSPCVYQHYIPPERWYKFPPLDVLRKVRRKMQDKIQAEEWEQCIDLLKAMLEMDPRKRITPSEVLNHPFMNPMAWNHGSSYLQMRKEKQQADLVLESISDSSDCEPSVTAPKDDGVTNIQSVSSSPLPSAASPRATTEHTMLQQESDISLQVHKNLTPASPDEESEKKNSDQEPPTTALSEEVTHNQTDHHSPSLMDQAGLNKVSESSVEVTEIQEKALMSKDANPGEAKQAKKKRKTICQRIVSWVRRNICPKRVSPLVDEERENF